MLLDPLSPRELHHLEEAIDRCLGHVAPFAGIAYRCSPVRWANPVDLMTGNGSAKVGGRWNPRGVRATYASTDLVTTVLEMVEGTRTGLGLHVSQSTPFVVTSIRVDLHAILDLTSVDCRSILDPIGFTPERLMADPWRRRRDSGGAELSPTIEIGRIAHGRATQGLIVPSNANPGGRNLVLFPEYYGPKSVAIINEDQLPPRP